MQRRPTLALARRPALPDRETVVTGAAGVGFYAAVAGVAATAAAVCLGAAGHALLALAAGDAAGTAAWFGLAVAAAATEAGPFYVALHDAPALRAVATEVRE